MTVTLSLRKASLFPAMSGTPAETPAYEEKSPLKNASLVALQAGGVGAFVSAIQNALGTHSKGAGGFFTRSGTTIGIFGTYRKAAGLPTK
jgi:hypothetical protein